MFKFKRTLKIGDEGKEVIDLQERLIEIGFNKAFIVGKIRYLAATGYFDLITWECVKQFQYNTKEFIKANKSDLKG